MRAFTTLAVATLALSFLPSALAVVAAAPAVHAPQSSLDGSLLFVFSGIDAGTTATVHVDGKTYQHTVTTSSFTIQVPHVADGFQRWWANVTAASGNITWSDTGFVDVDSSLVRVASQVGQLQKDVNTLQNRTAIQAGATRNLAQNVTKVQKGVDLLRASNASASPQAAVVQPGPVGLDLQSRNVLILLGIVGGCVLLLAVNVAIVLQVRKRNREAMVFLLALAGHEGVTPESPEFQQALEALHQKVKGKKDKKEKKDKKAKAAHPSIEHSRNDDPRLKARALVVEDSATDRLLLCQLLQQAGCDCDVAEDGREGVAAALSGTYDFVFMDVVMPEMDGCAATRFIHESLGPRSPFIVAVSTLRAAADRSRCAEAGMDYYLQKPVRKAALQVLLED